MNIWIGKKIEDGKCYMKVTKNVKREDWKQNARDKRQDTIIERKKRKYIWVIHILWIYG